jgi:drug/metabolite transporter (DMT)-like permease
VGSGRRYTVLAFCFLVIVWGSSFPVIKVGLDHAPPLLFAGVRTLLGGVCIAIAASVWERVPSFGRGMVGVMAVAAALNVVFFIGFQTLAVMYLPSGSAAVLIYLQPILTGFLAWIFLGEGLTPRKSLGLLLGFAGVVAVSSGSLSGELSPVGVSLGVLSALSWAGGTVYFKRRQDGESMLWFVAFMFLSGGLVLTLGGLAFEPWSGISWNAEFAASLAYTSVAGIAVAWILWLRLVSAGEASRVSAYIFFVPLVSVTLGAAFLGEKLSYSLLLGAALIVAGIYLVNRGTKGKAA